MHRRDFKRLPVAFALSLALCGSLGAAPLVGEFGFIGTGVAVLQLSGENFIDFSPSLGGSGVFSVTTVDPGSTFPYPAGSSGTIKDTSDTTPPTSPFSYLPVGITTSLSNYISIAGFNHNFVAQLLQAQGCPSVPGVLLCTGPFVLSAVGQNVSISASVLGQIINQDTGEISSFNLSLNGTVNNDTVSGVASKIQSSGGLTLNNWSGTLTAGEVPEPHTWTMLLGGIGLIGVGLFRRR